MLQLILFPVTALAFAFVPISLTPSIFGMNVQEIHSSGHSIWVFVVTAFAMVLVAAVGWLIYRALCNMRILKRKAFDDLKRLHGKKNAMKMRRGSDARRYMRDELQFRAMASSRSRGCTTLDRFQ